MVPLDEREGMDEEDIPETDLTRCYQFLDEGDKFESSILRLDRCFMALMRVDTHTCLGLCEMI